VKKAVVFVLLASSLVIVRGSSSKADEKSAHWMKQKLEMSQNILAGLTKGDFKAIESNGLQMNIVSFLEKEVAQDKPYYKEYMRQLDAFETANRELLRQASTKNIEGATLAYMQLTVSCVQCHKIVRDAKK